MIWDQPYNLAAGIGRQALDHPDRQAIVAADLVLTYRQVWLIAQAYALRMQMAGVDRRSIVCVRSNDLIVSVAVMIATALLGARFAVYEDRLVSDGIVQPSHVLRSPEVAAPPNLPSLLIDESWSPRTTKVTADTAAIFPGHERSDDGWWYLHTSGTTGQPKYMLLSHRAAFDRSRSVSGDFRGAETRFCSIFPCSARPFFVRAMAALLNGSTIVDALDPRFLMAQGVTLVCASPRQAAEWIASCPFVFRLPLLQVSGAPIAPDIARQLLTRFDLIEDVYGASETNKSFVNRLTLAGAQIAVQGVPQDSIVQIIDTDGAPVPVGALGEVRVRNQYTVPSYISAEAASLRAFRDGWFHPGDLGRFGPGGALEVSGRIDEVLNLGGNKIDPVTVDQVLLATPGVTDAACFRDPCSSITPRLMAFLMIAPGFDPAVVIESVKTRCLRDLASDVYPSYFFVVSDIPRTHDGTPRRRECEEMVRAQHRAAPPPREEPK